MRLAGPSDNFQPPGDRLEKKNLKIFHRKIWRLRKSPYLCSRNRETIATRVLWEIYIIQQVVQVLGKEIFRIDTVNRSMTLDYDKRIPERGYDKQFKQRRVWSWLRMNASDRLNTCKSRGSMVCSNTDWWRPAHGWVTRMQLTYQRGITRRKSD